LGEKRKKICIINHEPHVIYFLLLLLLLPSKVNIQRERMNKQTTNIIHGPLYQDSFFSIARKEKKKHESVKGFIFFSDVGVWIFFKNKMCFHFHQPFLFLDYYFDFSFFFSLIFSSLFFSFLLECR